MTDTGVYGQYYWCVKVTKNLSENGEIYVHADSINTTEDGALNLRSEKEYGTNLMIAAGEWLAVYAASVMDGSAIAVEHWKGEVQR